MLNNTVDDLIIKSYSKYGLKFNFKHTKVPKTVVDKICVFCPTHGSFDTQLRSFFSNKNGCPKCTFDSQIIPYEEIIKRANDKHMGFYTYTNDVELYRIHKKIRALCLYHGEFLQNAKIHIRGAECPQCSKLSKLSYFQENKINISNKKIDTCRLRYGVSNPSQVEKFHEKKFKYKKFTFPSGRTYNVQGYEPQALELLLSQGYTEEQLLLVKKPSIKYFWSSSDGYGDDKWHIYYPDIVIPTENRIIEVKSKWTFDNNGNNLKLRSQNLAKKNGSIELGWNHSFIIF